MSEDNKTTKFSEEELKALKELQTNYLSLQNKFGQIHMAKLNLQKQFDDLNKLHEANEQDFLKLQESETKLIESLTEKYGKGTLNPSSGEFTPSTSK